MNRVLRGDLALLAIAGAAHGSARFVIRSTLLAFKTDRPTARMLAP